MTRRKEDPLRIDHHVWIHDERNGEVEKKLDLILTALGAISAKEDRMSDQLNALTQKVQETEDVEEGAITLIGGLAAQIAAIKDDPVALQALADRLSAEKDKLAAAIAANTPAAP